MVVLRSRPRRHCQAEPRRRWLWPRAGAGLWADKMMPREGTSSQLSPAAPGRQGGNLAGLGGEGSGTMSVAWAQSCPQL